MKLPRPRRRPAGIVRSATAASFEPPRLHHPSPLLRPCAGPGRLPAAVHWSGRQLQRRPGSAPRLRRQRRDAVGLAGRARLPQRRGEPGAAASLSPPAMLPRSPAHPASLTGPHPPRRPFVAVGRANRRDLQADRCGYTGRAEPPPPAGGRVHNPSRSRRPAPYAPTPSAGGAAAVGDIFKYRLRAFVSSCSGGDSPGAPPLIWVPRIRCDRERPVARRSPQGRRRLAPPMPAHLPPAPHTAAPALHALAQLRVRRPPPRPACPRRLPGRRRAVGGSHPGNSRPAQPGSGSRQHRQCAQQQPGAGTAACTLCSRAAPAALLPEVAQQRCAAQLMRLPPKPPVPTCRRAGRRPWHCAPMCPSLGPHA